MECLSQRRDPPAAGHTNHFPRHYKGKSDGTGKTDRSDPRRSPAPRRRVVDTHRDGRSEPTTTTRRVGRLSYSMVCSYLRFDTRSETL